MTAGAAPPAPRASAASPAWQGDGDALRERPLVVLDDDPTGVQALAGVHVLLASDPDLIARCGVPQRSLHVMTNTRACTPERAYDVVFNAATTVAGAMPEAQIVLRGDSTLRGHLLEEYLGLRDAVLPGEEPPLLLVLALPAAGRVTSAGVHMLKRGGKRVPLDQTEYAGDGLFAYGDAHLLQWAEDRSGGHFRRSDGREIPLRELRSRGPDAVTEALLELASRGRPSVCAPDAESDRDLAVIAAGVRRAGREGARVVTRSAPAFVGILSGTIADGLVSAPKASDGLLVVCGSYVQTTTRQLEQLVRERPGTLVEADVDALASGLPDGEIERVARAADDLLRRGRLAVIATSRGRSPNTASLEAGERIALGMALVVRALGARPSTIVAKGGVTSAVTLQVGLDAREADVVGPLLPGVSLWRVGSEVGESTSYVVVPGNVGDDDLLAHVVDKLLGSARC